MNSLTCTLLDEKTTARMRWHLFTGVFNHIDMLVPGGGKVEFTEYYIFGIRVARIRL